MRQITGSGNRDNITALVIAITIVSVIVGFTIYFNNPSLNQAWSEQQQKDKGLVVGSGAHSPEFRLEKNYANMKSAAQRGINRPVIAAGMVEENHTMTTTMKLNTAQLKQIEKSQFVKAPEFAQIGGYINTPNNNSPITLSSLKGKVVLLYVWTYTCINSIRPMPYIDDWNQKYSDKGLVVVGVHSPEFQFEKKYANVKDAVKRFGNLSCNTR